MRTQTNYPKRTDYKVKDRASWGLYRGRRLFNIPDHGLSQLIEKSSSARMSNQAFDEWRDREKLGLLGNNP